MSKRTTVQTILTLAAGAMTATAVFVASANAKGPVTRPATQAPSVLVVCWHSPASSYRCPDTTMQVNRMMTGDSIVSGTLTVKTKRGRTSTAQIEGPFDAIFVDPEGVQKFLVPYYGQINKDSVKAKGLQRHLGMLVPPKKK